MPRSTRRQPDNNDPDDFDSDDFDSDDSDVDYDPDEPETYPHGLYDDDGPPLVPCPYCKREVIEDSEQCPYCGSYLSREDAPREAKSTFWIILMALALLGSLVWMLG